MAISNLAGLLFDADGPSDEVLVHIGDEHITRAELVASANTLRAALDGVGVEPRTAVGVMLSNGAPLVAAIFAVLAADATYVPLNPRLSDAELTRIIETIRPAAVITDQVERVPGLATVSPDGRTGWTGHGSADPSVPRLDDDVAFVQFTSGTTGRPKPVPLQAATVLALMDGVVSKIRSGKAGSPDRPAMPNLIPVSLSLWAGVYNVLFAFRVGAPVVLMASFDTREFARLVAEFEIRSVVLPPAAMTMLADDEDVTELTPLRIVRSVSAPLSPLQARRFRDRFGIVVLNGYGQTELGGEVVGWNAGDAREHGEAKLGSIGRPHENVELRIVGDDHVELGTDEVGELWIRTPSTASDGGDPTLADRLSADGYMRTGDLARVDADGFVWIEGRVSDMVNRGGLKVFPAEVVEVLLLHSLVRDAAVVGVPDDRLGEVPWAFVVTTEPVDPEELDRHCRDHLAPYKVPAEFRRIDEIPRNEAGKVVSRLLIAADGSRLPRPEDGGQR